MWLNKNITNAILLFEGATSKIEIALREVGSKADWFGHSKGESAGRRLSAHMSMNNVPLKCPKCAGVNMSSARFCSHCGNELEGAAQSATAGMQIPIGSVSTIVGKLSMTFTVSAKGEEFVDIFTSDPTDLRKSGVFLRCGENELNQLRNLLQQVENTRDALRAQRSSDPGMQKR